VLALALADRILVPHGRDRRWLDSLRQARGGCVCARLAGFSRAALTVLAVAAVRRVADWPGTGKVRVRGRQELWQTGSPCGAGWR
jgi:hypothetical protein